MKIKYLKPKFTIEIVMMEECIANGSATVIFSSDNGDNLKDEWVNESISTEFEW